MAAATGGVAVHVTRRDDAKLAAQSSGRRQISPQSGRALEILGHAIEYLTDEYVQSAEQVSAHDPTVEAVQLLMALNRKIYYECPLVPTLTERMRAFFGVAH